MRRYLTTAAVLLILLLFAIYPELLFVVTLFGVWLASGSKRGHRGRRWGGYSGLDGRGYL